MPGPAWCIAKAQEFDKKSPCVIAGVASSDPTVLHTERPAAKRATANFHAEPVLFSPVPGTSATVGLVAWYQETRWYHLYERGTNQQVPLSNKMHWVPSVPCSRLELETPPRSVLLGCSKGLAVPHSQVQTKLLQIWRKKTENDKST